MPAETATDVSGGNNLNIPVISATPIVTEVETMEAEARSPRTFLPNGSPSRPTATAILGHEHGCKVFWRDK